MEVQIATKNVARRWKRNIWNDQSDNIYDDNMKILQM